MTVRAWFTISALVLIALGVAVAVRILSPLQAPSLVVTAADTRLDGEPLRSCWPQRSGELRCVEHGSPELPSDGTDVQPEGRLRVIADFPVQPENGRVRILDRESGEVAFDEPLRERMRYELEPGAYVLQVVARWTEGAFVRYAFAFDAAWTFSPAER